jgi:hypothetical protein
VSKVKRRLFLLILLAAGAVLLPNQKPEHLPEKATQSIRNGIANLGAPWQEKHQPDGSGAPAADPAPPAAGVQGADGAAPLEQEQIAARIEEKYQAELLQTCAAYEARLNNLVAAASYELQVLEQSNPQVNRQELARRYAAEARDLEAQCDLEAYALLDAFEQELRDNACPTTAAQAARETYEATKQSRADQILSSVRP